MLGAIFQAQLTGAGENVLCFLGGVGVPAEPPAGLDLVDDGRGFGRPMAALGGKRTGPPDRRVVHSAHLRARKIPGRNDER